MGQTVGYCLISEEQGPHLLGMHGRTCESLLDHRLGKQVFPLKVTMEQLLTMCPIAEPTTIPVAVDAI